MRHLERLAASGALPSGRDRLQSFLTLAGSSPYLGRLLVQNPSFLDTLPAGGSARAPRTREDLEEDLARFLALNSGRDPSAALRLFKQREYLGIALADFLGTADLPAITRALSLLADVLLDKAVQMAWAPLERRFGAPTRRDDQGHLERATFAVIALGKLGGQELNYSSDIDLLYLFSRDGETSGSGAESGGTIGNKEFFTRLASDVTRLIAGRDPEGQVFRVDLDLRPGGRDGELVIPLGAAVAYFRNWADAWERQALIKARAAAGSPALGRRFIDLVEPLVYPETPDPFLTMEMTAMKDRIDARLSSEGRSETDIKLGRGGIREIEFAVQALQMLHGGRDPWLRQANTLLALHRLAEKGLVGYAEYATLSEAYTFLRDLEHRLQLGHDRQTATLPTDPAGLRILARRMRLGGAAPGDETSALAERLERHRSTVRAFYDSVFGRAAQKEITEEESEDLWVERLDEERTLARLRQHGLRDPETLLRPVRAVRRLLRPAATTPEIRRLLRKAGPILLKGAAEAVDARRAFDNLEKLLSAIGADPLGLLGFLSRREVLAPTMRLLGASDFLAGLFLRQPGLVATLGDRAHVLRTPPPEEYRASLLEAAAGRDPARAREGELRRRHNAALAYIAIRDINRQATLREVLKSLSNLADGTLEAVVRLAAEEAGADEPGGGTGPRLSVLGLGRLGYREMDYGSDLDLVFVREGGDDERARAFARRWCEAIVRVLSTLSRDGQLYKVDLRLRPSGREGDLVVSLERLRDYLRDSAEVWEMQSFLKARHVAGDPEPGARAIDSVESIVHERARAAGAAALASAVTGMRRRLLQDAPRPERRPLDLKAREGGLMDVHFIVEFLQLRDAVPNPADKDTLRLLLHLNAAGSLDEEGMRILHEGYLFFRALDHQVRLIHARPLPHPAADEARLAELARALDPAAPADAAAAARGLMEKLQDHTTSVHRVFERIVTG